MRMENSIREKLAQAFAPAELQVVNDSTITPATTLRQAPGKAISVSWWSRDAFAGKSRLERHRMVNAALAEELARRVHALAITALAPQERTKAS